MGHISLILLIISRSTYVDEINACLNHLFCGEMSIRDNSQKSFALQFWTLNRAAAYVSNPMNSTILILYSIDGLICCHFAWYFPLNVELDGIYIGVFSYLYSTYIEPLIYFVILCVIRVNLMNQFVRGSCNSTKICWQYNTLCRLTVWFVIMHVIPSYITLFSWTNFRKFDLTIVSIRRL